jgi:hypothetical protein
LPVYDFIIGDIDTIGLIRESDEDEEVYKDCLYDKEMIIDHVYDYDIRKDCYFDEINDGVKEEKESFSITYWTSVFNYVGIM